ncbi:MAG: hypothetical protein AABX28_02170 [Nanoarchaeota archaeon]
MDVCGKGEEINVKRFEPNNMGFVIQGVCGNEEFSVDISLPPEYRKIDYDYFNQGDYGFETRGQLSY